jgi:hypothetical protein
MTGTDAEQPDITSVYRSLPHGADPELGDLVALCGLCRFDLRRPDQLLPLSPERS